MQAPPQPKKRNWAGCVVGCLVALVLVIGLGAGGVLFLNNQAGGVTVGSLTIGGAGTGPGGGTLIYQDALNGSTKSDWTGDSNCFFGSGGYHINAAFICYSPADKVGDAVTHGLGEANLWPDHLPLRPGRPACQPGQLLRVFDRQQWEVDLPQNRE